MNRGDGWKIINPGGFSRIIVTGRLPGTEWLDILSAAGYRIEMWASGESMAPDMIADSLGQGCTAVIGQLTEKWDERLLGLLASAGGIAYCNYAVGFDNVDLDAATRYNIAVGNTPGVLTEATAELAVALTMACSRRICEAHDFTRAGRFRGWLPDLFLGSRLWRGTLGVIGAGRIGATYALMMLRAFEMDLVYAGHMRNPDFEAEAEAFNEYLVKTQRVPVKVSFTTSPEDVLREAAVVSLHVPLRSDTRHLISGPQLLMMRPDAILINTSRGAVINEAELAEHCRTHPDFRAGLDVFESEPIINEGLKDLPNVVMVPHIGSATRWTRENMAKLAALNIKGVIERYPVWEGGSIGSFLGDDPPRAIPSILNRSALR